MRLTATIVCAIAASLATVDRSAAAKRAEPPPPPPEARLHDTAGRSAAPLTGEAVAKAAGWSRVPEGRIDHQLKGDLVCANNRLAVVLRKGAAAADIYARAKVEIRRKYPFRLKDAVRLYASAGPAGADGQGGRLAAVRIVENTASSVAVDADFAAAGGVMTLRLSMKMGQPYLAVEARKAAEYMRVTAPGRFAVLPDFFTDDLVFDAADIEAPAAGVPSENILLHMVAGGDAIVTCIWQNRDQDVQVALSGSGGQRRIEGSTIRFGKGKRAWVAVLAARGMWHASGRLSDAGGILAVSGSRAPQRLVGLDWVIPFAAIWRASARRTDGLTESHHTIVEVWKPEGPNQPLTYIYRKYLMGRQGAYAAPKSLKAIKPTGWPYDYRPTDKHLLTFYSTGQGFMTARRDLLGPTVIYPMHRTITTPPEAFVLTDLLRATLGVGPCEYILDADGLKAEHRGMNTCAVRNAIKKIFDAGQQGQKRAEVELLLGKTVVFIRHIRQRIANYVGFAERTLEYIDAQRRAQPAIVKSLGPVEADLKRLLVEHEKAAKVMKTTAEAVGLIEQFRKELASYEGDGATKRMMERFGVPLVAIGFGQDNLLAKCRQITRVARQKAGAAMLRDPSAAAAAGEVRRRMREVLRHPAKYEKPSR